jgi:hypothetical protein
MNKRGGLGDIFEHLASLWVYVLIALAIAIFIFLVKSDAISPIGNNLTFEKMAENVDINMINFLRTPTEFDFDKDGVEEETTFGELIIHTKHYPKTTSPVEEKIKSFLDCYYGPHCYSFWFDKISVSEESLCGDYEAKSDILLPSINGETVKVKLWITSCYPEQISKCFRTPVRKDACIAPMKKR